MNKNGRNSSVIFHGNNAAVYLRMSTEHQQYSMDNQAEAIEKYADLNGLKIVRKYCDGGKSGLDLKGRAGLQSLIADTQLGNTDYRHILVLDITRWGRFQDPDESGHYEFICRNAGYAVHYVNEPFSNDGSMQSNLLKNLKRSLAGSYSSELSNKVFSGQCRLVKMGFKLGSAPRLGLRRVLVSADGKRKMILQPGERKSLQTDRVILEPGPKEEVRLVREIYSLFVDKKMGESEIARYLKGRGTPCPGRRPWCTEAIQRILSNEKYIGNNIFNRTSQKLKTGFVKNPESEWVRCDGAFKGIVDPKYFEAAQRIRSDRMTRGSDERLLADLKKLFKRHGKLTAPLINKTPKMHCAATYRARFGSLSNAYAKVGFKVWCSQDWVEVNQQMRAFRTNFVMGLVLEFQRRGFHAVPLKRCKMMAISEGIKISCIIARWQPTQSGRPRWLIRDNPVNVDFALVVRMDQDNLQPIDYYLIPGVDLPRGRYSIFEENGTSLDAYRVRDLDLLFSLADTKAIVAV